MTTEQSPEQVEAEAQISVGQRYVVESKWCGWWGGWGSERDIAAILNRRAQQGYRLLSTKSIHGLWFLLVPRPKLLMFFEREAD